MTFEEQINMDMKKAMKAKDKKKLRGLRAIKSAILLAKTDGSGKPLDETAQIKLLEKLVKQRKESLEIFEKENRPELAEKEKEEIEVISAYLPKQLSEEELEEEIDRIIEEVGAESMQDMGKVMGKASQQLAGRADGKTMADMVKKKLET
jgi:hypothetical protein